MSYYGLLTCLHCSKYTLIDHSGGKARDISISIVENLHCLIRIIGSDYTKNTLKLKLNLHYIQNVQRTLTD